MSSAALQAFRQDRFGLFIHWGLYSLAGGRWEGRTTDYIGEWLQAKFRIPNAEYGRLAQRFDPKHFDADLWAAKAAAAGMKYLVYTAKHHDGFAMYHSAVSDFNVVDATPYRRDPLAALAAACSRHGLKLGIYYSHYLDWHEPNGGDPGGKTRNAGGMSWGNDWDFPDRSAKRFDEYFHHKALPQLRELLTRYGDISLLWCDCPMDIDARHCREIRALVHELRPNCLINSRIGHGYGDYASLGDNQLPAGFCREAVEAPGTLNDTWGFKFDDHNWKTPEQVIERMAMLASKGANGLVNVGPTGDGDFPERANALLDAVAAWRRVNGDGLHGAPSPFGREFDFAYCTHAGARLDLLLRKPGGVVEIPGIRNAVVHAEVPHRQEGGVLRLDTAALAGRFLPRVSVLLDGPPDIDPGLQPRNGVLLLEPATAARRFSRAVSDVDDNSVFRARRPMDNDADFDVAGMRRVGAAGPALEPGGALVDWHSPGDGLEWEILFPEAGVYRIGCLTRGLVHGGRWHGDREVEIRWGQRRIRAPLRADRAADDPYYPSAESELGELEVAAGEKGTLSLTTRSVNSIHAEQMSLVRLTITRKETAMASCASAPAQSAGIHDYASVGRKRFTLIELLVVVAIISVLASLLLPALQRAREQALLVNCVAKMKQMGVGVMLYSFDHNDTMPLGYGQFESNTSVYWTSYLTIALAPYYGVDTPYVGPNKAEGITPTTLSERHFSCPNEDFSLVENSYKADIGKFKVVTNYQFTCLDAAPLSNTKWGGGIYSKTEPMKWKRVPQVSDGSVLAVEAPVRLIRVDARKVGFVPTHMQFPGWSSANANWTSANRFMGSSFAHAGASGFLFIDGHVAVHARGGISFNTHTWRPE